MVDKSQRINDSPLIHEKKEDNIHSAKVTNVLSSGEKLTKSIHYS